jgi:hypothetical protein
LTDYPNIGQHRCCVTGRDLRPGERFFGVLVDTPAGLSRLDYAVDAWPGPPEKAVGFWSGKVPANQVPRKRPLDDQVIREHFLAPETSDSFRFVLALLLVRRKQLKLEGSSSGVLRLVDAKTGAKHELVDPALAGAELAAVQSEVMNLLTRAEA